MATYETSKIPKPQLHGMKFTPVEMEVGKRKQAPATSYRNLLVVSPGGAWLSGY